MYVAAAFFYAAVVGATVFLALKDHPVVAVLVLLAGLSVSFSSKP